MASTTLVSGLSALLAVIDSIPSDTNPYQALSDYFQSQIVPKPGSAFRVHLVICSVLLGIGMSLEEFLNIGRDVVSN